MNTEVELSTDFYQMDSAGAHLKVATVANSRFYSAKDFQAIPATSQFAISSNSETLGLWAELKQQEDVFIWYDLDPLGLIIF